MAFTFSFKAFAHDFINIPSSQGGSNIDLTIINAIGAFLLQKGGVTSQTEYLVLVANPAALGIASHDQVTINRACQDLVLACNVVLVRTAMNASRIEPTKPLVAIVQAPPEVIVNEDGSVKEVRIAVGGGIRSEVSFVVGSREDLDETRAVAVALGLSRLDRFNLQAGAELRRSNLVSALHEFEAAFAAPDRLSCFKYLYSTLELLTNIDGVDTSGAALDTKMAAATTISATSCAEWRNLNNRTKHIHRSDVDISTFIAGIEKVNEYNPAMRGAAGTILERLLT